MGADGPEMRKSPFGEYRVRGTRTSRLEGFSDAVFGFSATLLVVSLEVPRTFEELAANLRGFIAFALTFLALVLIWSSHRAFFRRYGLTDGLTTVLNSVLLFVVLFFVYPLKFLSVGFVARFTGIDASGVPGGASPEMYGTDAEVGQLFVIYGLGFVAVFLCFALLYRHALRKADELGLDAVERFDARSLIYHYLILVGVGMLSVGITLSGRGGALGGVGGWVYGILGPVGFLYGYLRDRWRRKVRDAAG